MPDKKLSLEERFLEAYNRLPVRGIRLVPQYQFCCTRKFRLDFAIPHLLIGIEIDGLGYGGRMGRHQTAAGIASNCDKQNLAAELGWVILRHTASTLGSKIKVANALRQLLNVIIVRNKQLSGSMK